MSMRPGSFCWLLAHDIRLGWRGFTAMFGGASRGVVLAALLAGGIVLHAIAWPVALWLSPWVHGAASGPVHGAGADVTIAPLVAVVTCAFSWMLAQSLFSASRTLYVRGDLDLLLSSPLPARHVFAAKATSIAGSSFASIALLTLPIANAGAVLDTPAWLGLYPALISLALIATALGLALTMALFALVGPRRARLWTQMTGAVIAGAFVLGAQIAAMLSAPMRAAISDWLDLAWAAGGSGPLGWVQLPIAAVRGDFQAAAVLAAIAIAMFTAATFVLGQRFVNASLAASGAVGGGEFGQGAGTRPRFRAGLASNMRRKEWRLLARDPGMFAQLSLQIIYTLPVAVVLLRQDGLPSAFALAPTIVVVAAQVAASLAWITVSGEDAPELIATAPVASAAVDRAKLDAVALPVLSILALPLIALAVASWQAAVVTALVAAAASTSTALLNFWHPMPGNRRGMLRRHSQSKLIALLEHGLALLWAVAVVLAIIGSAFVAVPVTLVVVALTLMRGRTRTHAAGA